MTENDKDTDNDNANDNDKVAGSKSLAPRSRRNCDEDRTATYSSQEQALGLEYGPKKNHLNTGVLDQKP